MNAHRRTDEGQGARRMNASAKALRLLSECRVTPQPAAAVFEVVGDHDTYRVIVGDGWVQCPCPAHREMCSHAEAAVLLHGAMVDREPAGAVDKLASKLRDSGRHDEAVDVEDAHAVFQEHRP